MGTCVHTSIKCVLVPWRASASKKNVCHAEGDASKSLERSSAWICVEHGEQVPPLPTRKVPALPSFARSTQVQSIGAGRGAHHVRDAPQEEHGPFHSRLV